RGLMCGYAIKKLSECGGQYQDLPDLFQTMAWKMRDRLSTHPDLGLTEKNFDKNFLRRLHNNVGWVASDAYESVRRSNGESPKMQSHDLTDVHEARVDHLAKFMLFLQDLKDLEDEYRLLL